MPLKKGPNSIGPNLKKLMHEGKDHDQALAIALDIARGRKKQRARKPPARKK